MRARALSQRTARSRSSSQSDDRILRLSKDGTFQIAVFEDLHFAEDDDDDDKTKEVMKSVLSEEVVQLVVLNGDLISGEAVHSSNSSDHLHNLVSPLVEVEQPWASTYGNHDSDANLDPYKDIFKHETQYPTCLTKSDISGPGAGVTNYYLMVYPYDESSGPPALLLWFFDSRGGKSLSNCDANTTTGARGDWVDKSVTRWFIETNSHLTRHFGRTIPSLAFYHIPVHAMRAYQKEGVNESTTPGINGETVVSQGSGDTDYAGQDSPFMQSLLNTTGLIATFSGHDHDNDWCFKWNNHIEDQNLTGNGLNMCYGRHTGYGGYGNASRGARQILFNQESLDKEIYTWIRLEDGSVSAAVTLNSTYGEDHYMPGLTILFAATFAAFVVGDILGRALETFIKARGHAISHWCTRSIFKIE
ncbi:hypothetical protein N7532_007248 [Penicillium argentinense]|uniref:Calcineurin-like phosphoesterase domain-containing protein n=1 Tax=Penicillium argentinense TaxID=1131581 RepID=A0A9W9F7J9_9EURO|nr:uncharacterized protein N7532_007248 [Penicillium argentinense]KAJ5094957.1 hypothetical protein N7532_007248 [Penicillium argentinense]